MPADNQSFWICITAGIAYVSKSNNEHSPSADLGVRPHADTKYGIVQPCNLMRLSCGLGLVRPRATSPQPRRATSCNLVTNLSALSLIPGLVSVDAASCSLILASCAASVRPQARPRAASCGLGCLGTQNVEDAAGHMGNRHRSTEPHPGPTCLQNMFLLPVPGMVQYPGHTGHGDCEHGDHGVTAAYGRIKTGDIEGHVKGTCEHEHEHMGIHGCVGCMGMHAGVHGGLWGRGAPEVACQGNRSCISAPLSDVISVDLHAK
ncbi:hypothetical protein JTB14_015139 [Gonioctena quinquepunctata]|nr:hypothetical protein JTB14_015139 [Gonioctena quinquepunctata]